MTKCLHDDDKIIRTLSMTKEQGTLYLVATPIGNPDDISKRALGLLANVDKLYCEERKPAYRLLTRYNIRREVTCLNEHNEAECCDAIGSMLKKGLNVAYFSDCGTPVLADPGFKLLASIRARGGRVTAVPGVSSITVALSLSPFPIDRYMYYGFVSAKPEQRRQDLQEIASIPVTTVLLETPYRLQRIMVDLVKVIGRKKKCCLLLDLTCNNEMTIIGTPAEVATAAKNLGKKHEFVILLSPPL